MPNGPCFFVLLAVPGGSGVPAEAIQVAPANPQHYSYQCKPILLVNRI
jgi:hypothetical protein